MKASPATEITTPVKAGLVARKCGCHGSCDSCRDHDKDKEAGKAFVHRRANGAAATRAAPTNAVSRSTTQAIRAVASGGGQALPAATRAALEPRFGKRDFSGVRVHSGEPANKLARDLGADAFTVGRDIFFGSGRYDPHAPAGQRLLAHELTHVAQQGEGASHALQAKLELGSPNTAAEHEADRVADAVVRGLTAGPIGAHDSGAIRRAPIDPASTPDVIVLPISEPCPVSADKASDDYDDLYKQYSNYANAGRLQTLHAGRPFAEGDTDKLWELWAAGRGDEAQEIKNEKDDPEKPLRKKCSPDHVVELQVGGSEFGTNLRLLERARNVKAGTELSQRVAKLNRDHFGEPWPTNKILRFTAVTKEFGTPKLSDECLAAEKRVGGPGTSGTKNKLSFKVGAKSPKITITHSKGVVDEIHQFAIPALRLLTVKEKTIAAETYVQGKQAKRIPFLTDQPFKFDLVVGAGDVIKFGANAPTTLKAVFPFLSTAFLVPRLEEGEWRASGDFVSDKSFLKSVVFHLDFRNQQLTGTVSVPPEKLKQALPIPGLSIDNCNISIALSDETFSASGGVGFHYGSLAKGKVVATWAPGTGFLATGDVDLTIPGLTAAHGKARVADGEFGGEVALQKGNVKLPFVSDVAARIAIEKGVLTGAGGVTLKIPGLNSASIDFTAGSTGDYAIRGRATGKIPGLKDVGLDLAYANGDLSGSGHVGFSIPLLESAGVDLAYAKGLFSGAATIVFKRGKLSGTAIAHLTPTHKVSGTGQLSYEIVPGLVAGLGLEILETGDWKAVGELKLPDPIELFAEKLIDKKLFGFSLDIPIFGITFGSSSVGVIANLSLSINARAGIGPGQVRKPRILVAFDPKSEHGITNFEAGAELYIPAHAELAVILAGGIGVSLLIVKALGGISATASAGLFGALVMPIQLKYTTGKLALDGAAEIFAEPKLRFQLDAFVKVQADLFVTTIDVYTKNWKLAAFEWGSGFRIGVRFPVHYVFGEPFNLSISQLEFTYPQIEARKLITDLLPK